jgi:DUF1680 family protein
MRTAIILSLAILLASCITHKKEKSAYPIEPVKITEVKLTDNFWLPKVKTVQQKTISYAIDKCSKEGRFENFLIAGGKMSGKTRGKMPFDDTDVYKIIEGASYSLLSSPDPTLEATIDSMIAIIKIGQEADGYLTTYKTIDTTYAPAWWCPAGGRWKNEECSHELYNSGHMFEAAAAHFYATGKRNFLDIALKNADLLVSVFGKGKNETVPGHQIVETGLIKLYQVTNEKKYLDLAKHFLDNRGNSKVRPIWGPYNQDHKPVIEQDEVVGHAVRAVYMYAGMTDIAALYHDSTYLKAVNALWTNMVSKKMYLTGGIGSKHDGEAFGENYELPNLTAYNETCAAIGSVYWNHRLFLLSGDVKYYDIIERTLYNGLIAGISISGEEFFYPNPLEADGKYDFNQGHCSRAPWFDCSCCPTNVIRFLPSISNYIYATGENCIYVNLFMSNNANISIDDQTIKLTQQTNYPWDGKITMTVDPEKKGLFAVKIRIPGWAKNEVAPGGLYAYLYPSDTPFSVKVDGNPVGAITPDGYFTITRKWSKGDRIDVEFPMEVKRVITSKEVPSNNGLVALEYGPVVYCAEEADNNDDIFAMRIDDGDDFAPLFDANLLGGVNVLKTKAEKPVVLIPYYVWSNRGVGKMKVWIPRT